MKRLITLTALSSALLLSACGGPTDEEIARQEAYEMNTQNAPEWTEEQQEMIHESRGVVISEEEGEDEELVEVRNSFSPGEETVNTLASMTRDELIALDSTSHMEIFINGVIRDEYTVAAHTLYGAEQIEEFKKDFKVGLLTELESDNGDELPEGTTYVDRIGLRTDIQDGSVARHHVDVIIGQLNRIFVQIIPQSNFGDRVTVDGQVYPVQLTDQLERLNNATFEFTGIVGERYRNSMEEEDLAELNTYYNEAFSNALLEAPISEDAVNQSEIGGFEQREDGTWAPAQMPIFAWNLVSLIYGIR